jgi:MinD-like ATPase involved in chromosome partitioning or flagellar assembly
MPLIALASVKSSPGVTTTALALASMWKTAPRRLLVEADPGGGDLGLWLGLPAGAGLAGLAAAARHGHEAGLAWRHARELPGGTHLVAAPAGAEQAAACVAALAAAKLPQELAAADEPVLADCGRLYPGSPALAVAAAAAFTLLVVRPRVSELAHLEPRVRGLEQAGLRLSVVLAADDRRPPSEPSYPAEEIAGVLGVPVQGPLPSDPRAVEQLCRRAGDPGPAGGLPLLREAAAAAGALEAALGHPPAAPDLPGGPRDLDEREAVVGDRG